MSTKRYIAAEVALLITELESNSETDLNKSESEFVISEEEKLSSE